jgi:hypothetical protein
VVFIGITSPLNWDGIAQPISGKEKRAADGKNKEKPSAASSRKSPVARPVKRSAGENPGE